MNIPQQRQLDRFHRITQFLDQHSGEFAPGAKALALQNDLKGVVGNLGQASSTPKGDRKAKSVSTSRKLATLNELRQELSAIERTASAIAASNPKFKNTFILPDRRYKNELLATAKQFLKSARPVKARFEEFEMSGDFLERLQGRIDAYEAAQAGKAVESPKKDVDASGVDAAGELIAEGARLCGILDVVISNKYWEAPEVMEQWREASALKTPLRKKRSSGKKDSK